MSIRICSQLRKHKEVIIAYLNGAKIQCYNRNYAKWYNTTYPNWELGTKYRVKPEEITVWVNIYPTQRDVHLDKDLAHDNADKGRIACIPITYTEGEGL